MNCDETLEPVLWQVEGWLDRWPWVSRYYTNVLLPALGVSSAWSILLILALHVLLIAVLHVLLIAALLVLLVI